MCNELNRRGKRCLLAPSKPLCHIHETIKSKEILTKQISELRPDAEAFRLLSSSQNMKPKMIPPPPRSPMSLKPSVVEAKLNKRVQQQAAEIDRLKEQLRKTQAELSQKNKLVSQMKDEFIRYQIIKTFEIRKRSGDNSSDYNHHRVLRNRLAHSTNVVSIC